MKSLFIFLTITLNLIAQNYQQGKIDMHGGKYDKYNSVGGFQNNSFGSVGTNISGFLDKNSTKNKSTKNPEPKK